MLIKVFGEWINPQEVGRIFDVPLESPGGGVVTFEACITGRRYRLIIEGHTADEVAAEINKQWLAAEVEKAYAIKAALQTRMGCNFEYERPIAFMPKRGSNE